MRWRRRRNYRFRRRLCLRVRRSSKKRACKPRADPQTLELLETAGSDPLYMQLCQAQACFRARLTPKPWRSGITVPPSRYPFQSQEQEAKYRRWQTDYDRAIARFGVCRLVAHTGITQIAPQIEPIVALHDQLTAVASNRPLA